MLDFDLFLLWIFAGVIGDPVVNVKKGNLNRKHKNKTFWTLTDLWKILKSVRHQMLSKLSSLNIASLRKLDEEANKFYD